ncbi:MAG: hypothetical protein ACOZBL_03950 [Patescibacteria group bacterium]
MVTSHVQAKSMDHKAQDLSRFTRFILYLSQHSVQTKNIFQSLEKTQHFVTHQGSLKDCFQDTGS